MPRKIPDDPFNLQPGGGDGKETRDARDDALMVEFLGRIAENTGGTSDAQVDKDEPGDKAVVEKLDEILRELQRGSVNGGSASATVSSNNVSQQQSNSQPQLTSGPTPAWAAMSPMSPYAGMGYGPYAAFRASPFMQAGFHAGRGAQNLGDAAMPGFGHASGRVMQAFGQASAVVRSARMLDPTAIASRRSGIARGIMAARRAGDLARVAQLRNLAQSTRNAGRYASAARRRFAGMAARGGMAGAIGRLGSAAVASGAIGTVGAFAGGALVTAAALYASKEIAEGSRSAALGHLAEIRGSRLLSGATAGAMAGFRVDESMRGLDLARATSASSAALINSANRMQAAWKGIDVASTNFSNSMGVMQSSLATTWAKSPFGEAYRDILAAAGPSGAAVLGNIGGRFLGGGYVFEPVKSIRETLDDIDRWRKGDPLKSDSRASPWEREVTRDGSPFVSMPPLMPPTPEFGPRPPISWPFP